MSSAEPSGPTDAVPLADQECEEQGAVTLTPAQIAVLAPQLPRWTVVNGHHLERKFSFPDFAEALEFVNLLGAEAERQGHHPDLQLGWGRVVISLHSHELDGLTLADFVLAARFDRLHPPA